MRKKLLNECLIELHNHYPKEKDLKWEIQAGKGKWIRYHKPYYRTDYNTYSEVKACVGNNKKRECETEYNTLY